MPSIIRRFILPDLFSLSSAFPDATNPHWKRAAAESRDWVNSYRVFSDEQRRAFFTSGQSELLCSHAYPYAGYEEFRTCCDFVNLLFVLDEISDEQTAGDAWTTGRIFLNVLNDPDWEDGSKVAQMTRELRARLISTGVKPNTFRRLKDMAHDYIASVVEEAALRERGEVLDIDSYIVLRRNNSAVLTCFALIPYILGIDLPDEVVEDPMFSALNIAAVDMVCWANDLYSYDMEQAKGLEGNNIMTVLTEMHGLTMQEASDHVGEQYSALMDKFLRNQAALRSFGPSVDADVRLYVDAVRHWPRGNLSWSFETPRYFRDKRAEIKQTLVVVLRPRPEPKEKSRGLEQPDSACSSPVSA